MISKIETGDRPPAEDFPPRLDAVPELDTRGALTRLWDHLKKGHKQRLYGWFQEWADIEDQATILRWYEPLVVPGLLQTEDYARAILSARPDGNLDDLDEQVAARLARQAILDRTSAPQLWRILDEGVLHRAIGGSKVMRSQLYRLAEVAEHPKTTIQVIRSGGVHAGLLAHFVVADLDGKPPAVYLETAAEGHITDSSSAVAHVAPSFDRLRAGAESWAASRDLIKSGRGTMDVTCVAWRTSSYSGSNGGTCAEVGTADLAVAVRDSKHPDSPQLAFAADTWKTFTEQLKATA